MSISLQSVYGQDIDFFTVNTDKTNYSEGDTIYVSGDVDEVSKDNAHRAFYMHGCSHWIGLDVHDVGDYNQAGAERSLEPGMVFTVEPGIYIDSEANCDAKWHGIGVRIEDDILITDSGCRVMGKPIPKTVKEIEELMT